MGKKPDDELQQAFHKYTLRAATMIEQEELSISTIARITEGTQKLTMHDMTTFYKQLLELLQTTKTEEEILNKGLGIRDSLLNH